MEKARYTARSAVMLLLTRELKGETQVLLQKRRNTGYADGMWDCGCSGHVEEGEPMSAAMLREAREELGIAIRPERLRFATMIHKYTRETGIVYYNGFFTASEYQGTLKRNEPEKCEELRWFSVNCLPPSLLEDRKEAIGHFFSGIPYSEYGW